MPEGRFHVLSRRHRQLRIHKVQPRLRDAIDLADRMLDLRRAVRAVKTIDSPSTLHGSTPYVQVHFNI
jgi:hypothetical protein